MAESKHDDREKVNPRIAKGISNVIKPYWEKINKTSDYYSLRLLALKVDKINVRVKVEVEALLEAYKNAAQTEIQKRIKKLHGNQNENQETQFTEDFLNKHKVDSKYISTVHDSIYGSNVISLSIEDYQLITKNSKKAKFYSIKLNSMEPTSMKKTISPKLKETHNAILIITGNSKTTLDELSFIWDSVLRELPKGGKTAFAYKIANTKNIQLGLLAVR